MYQVQGCIGWMTCDRIPDLHAPTEGVGTGGAVLYNQQFNKDLRYNDDKVL
jgi:hypothetical protein